MKVNTIMSDIELEIRYLRLLMKLTPLKDTMTCQAKNLAIRVKILETEREKLSQVDTVPSDIYPQKAQAILTATFVDN